MSTVGLVTEVLDLLPEFLETYFMVKIIGIVLVKLCEFSPFPLSCDCGDSLFNFLGCEVGAPM